MSAIVHKILVYKTRSIVVSIYKAASHKLTDLWRRQRSQKYFCGMPGLVSVSLQLKRVCYESLSRFWIWSKIKSHAIWDNIDFSSTEHEHVDMHPVLTGYQYPVSKKNLENSSVFLKIRQLESHIYSRIKSCRCVNESPRQTKGEAIPTWTSCRPFSFAGGSYSSTSACMASISPFVVLVGFQ